MTPKEPSVMFIHSSGAISSNKGRAKMRNDTIPFRSVMSFEYIVFYSYFIILLFPETPSRDV